MSRLTVSQERTAGQLSGWFLLLWSLGLLTGYLGGRLGLALSFLPLLLIYPVTNHYARRIPLYPYHYRCLRCVSPDFTLDCSDEATLERLITAHDEWHEIRGR